ncbi:MAG: helix-turn-helix transcriptional regulator [Acidobacteriota bacterium]
MEDESLNPENLGRALEILLKRAGITRVELVSRVRGMGSRITGTAVSSWLRGQREPTYSNLMYFLKALGSDLCELQAAKEQAAREKAPHEPPPADVDGVMEKMRRQVESDPESRQVLRRILDTLGEQTGALKELSERLDESGKNRGGGSGSD